MLVKNTFRTEIKEILLEEMSRGEIIPGTRISLPQLAKKLEISVTPIREALTQLTEIGLITYIPNRGFFVAELEEKEATEIFETISILECAAIQTTSFQKSQLDDLETINELFRKAKSSLEKLNMDALFHQKLLEHYSNQYALKIIEDIRVRISIYEHRFMSSQTTDESVRMHHSIIQLLRAGKQKEAAKVLRSNWHLSVQAIINHYQTNQHEN